MRAAIEHAVVCVCTFGHMRVYISAWHRAFYYACVHACVRAIVHARVRETKEAGVYTRVSGRARFLRC